MADTNSAYAVIKAGGKQYRVSPGSKILVHRLDGEAGSAVTFSDVLMMNNGSTDIKIGSPLIAGAKVSGKILAQRKEAKIIVYRKNRRTGFTKKRGHRQQTTQVLIENIG